MKRFYRNLKHDAVWDLDDRVEPVRKQFPQSKMTWPKFHRPDIKLSSPEFRERYRERMKGFYQVMSDGSRVKADKKASKIMIKLMAGNYVCEGDLNYLRGH